MKKLLIAITSIAILACIIVALNSSSLNATNQTNQPNSTLVHYIVSVHLPNNNLICGSYLIRVEDEFGALITPVQSFIQGVVSYHFYELGPILNGARVARLVTDPGLDNVCRSPLVTTPDAIFTNFYNGMTYNFNLYPSDRGAKND
jgi:hypothetical protein